MPADPAFPNAPRLTGTEGMHPVTNASSALAIIAKPVEHALLPGRPTRMRAKFLNALEETSIIHWHGLNADSNNDCHPNYAAPP